MYLRILLIISAIFIINCISVYPAVGIDDYVEDLTDDLHPEQAEKSGNDYVIMPIPLSNPTVGSGLALAVMFLYDVGENAPTSNTTFGAVYTDTESWGVGFGQKTYFSNDNYRLNAVGGYFNLNLDFYGVGTEAGNRGFSIPLNQKGIFFTPDLMKRLFGGLHFGVRYRLLTCTTSLRIDRIGPIEIPDASLDVTTAGLGVIMNYDTRDNPLNPTTGTFLEIKTCFTSEELDSDQEYNIFEASYNRYLQATKNGVLALGVNGRFTSGDVPFFDLSYFTLRGYVGGQYRDNHMIAAQAEYRWQVLDRIGLVFFGGAGTVAPEIDQFDFKDLLPNAGVGLRIMASKEKRVNVSIDYAVGRGSDAFYFMIGEAF